MIQFAAFTLLMTALGYAAGLIFGAPLIGAAWGLGLSLAVFVIFLIINICFCVTLWRTMRRISRR